MTFLKRTSTKKLAILAISGLLATVFLSAGYSFAQTDTSVLAMHGATWSLKIDATLQTALESKNQPYVSVAKAGAEKELFLTLNSLADCKAGQIEFKIDIQGLTFYKQLPLNQEIDTKEYTFVNETHAINGSQTLINRPIESVNSFAGFDSKAQKQIHIYASKLIDAKGNEIWVDSNITQNALIVYLPQKWLETATFPVIVDPTFGYTSIGATNGTFDVDRKVASKFTLSEDGDVTYIVWYGSSTGSSIKVGLYSDNSGSPNSLLFQVTNSSISSLDWYYSAINQSLSTGTYWLTISGQSGITNYWDSGAANQWAEKWEGVTYSSELTNPFSSVGWYGDRQISMYIIYESINPTPTPTPTPTVTNNIFAGIAILMFMIIIGFVLSLKPYSIINIVYGILVLSVTAGLLLGGYLAGLWFFAFAGVAVGLICLLRGTDLL